MEISLVIATHNRAHLLARSFKRLADLTPPNEIIVIDDGGNDNTREVCQEYAPQIGVPVTYAYNDNPGPTICSLARNIGVRMSKHEWIATSEPELVFLSDVISQYREIHPKYPIDVISSGKVWFAPQGYDPGGDVSGLERAGDYTPPHGSQEAIGWVAPYTGLWKKEWLVEIGGWDETFPGPWGWDDIDLLTRLRIQGHGQHIDLGIQGVHQWHGLGGDVNFINEKHFRAKSFQGGEYDLTDVIANKEHEWGKLRIASN